MSPARDDATDHDRLTYLFSSSTGVPTSFFQGYAFTGADLVVGSRGAAAYRDINDRLVPPGEDGCYVTVVPGIDGPEIGVDSAGLMKLFCYSADGVWCVSNSLARMARHLRASGVELRPNPSQLVALRLPTTFVEQLSTPTTMFADIRLVPLGRKLVITARGPREVPAAPVTEALDYPVALQRFVKTWSARLGTVLCDDRVRVSADLSGGLDSRVVFALTANAAGPRSLDDAVQFVSGRSVAQQQDLVVAQQIADRYGATINRPLAVADSEPYSAAESYEGWRDLCLGLYLPIYLPKVRLTPWSVNLSGLGGESHRPFYPQKSPKEFVEDFRSDAPVERIAAWREDVSRLLEQWVTDDASVHPLIRHYREFRGRFHGGLFAQTKINVTPLSSRLMEPMVRSSGGGRRLFFDVMENALPGVMDMEYDVPAKAPTDDDRAHVTRVPSDGPGDPGAVYASTDQRQSSDATGASALELLAGEFEESSSAEVRDLLGRRVVDGATDLVERAVVTGSFGHARRASNVTRVMSAAMVLSPVARSAGLP